MNNRGIIKSLILIFAVVLILAVFSFDFAATAKVKAAALKAVEPAWNVIEPIWDKTLEEPWTQTIRPFLVDMIGHPILDLMTSFFVAGKNELEEAALNVISTTTATST